MADIVYLFDHRVHGVTAVLETLCFADHALARSYAQKALDDSRGGTTRIDVYACDLDAMTLLGTFTTSGLDTQGVS